MAAARPDMAAIHAGFRRTPSKIKRVKMGSEATREDMATLSMMGV